MEVDCPVYRWTPNGMTRWDHVNVGYIRKFDAERLLEEAHTRGYMAGLSKAKEIVKEASSG